MNPSGRIARAEAYQRLARGLCYPGSDDELAGEYTRLFSQGVAVSPYERSYLGDDLGVGLGQLAALYEIFGVRAGGDEGDIVDHIGVELEFASFLLAKEDYHRKQQAPEDQEAADVVRDARATFMTEHLGRWSSLFADKLFAEAQHPYYQELAQELRIQVAEDLAEQGWQIERPQKHLPVLQPQPEEAMTCPQASPS